MSHDGQQSASEDRMSGGASNGMSDGQGAMTNASGAGTQGEAGERSDNGDQRDSGTAAVPTGQVQNR